MQRQRSQFRATGSLSGKGGAAAAAGYLVQVNAVLAMIALTLAAMGIYSAIPPFLAMPSTALVGAAAAAGLAW